MVGAVCSWKLCPWDPAQLGFKAAHTRVGGRSVHTCPRTPTGCGSAGCGRPSGPFAAPGEGAVTQTRVPQSRHRSLPTPERLHLDSSPNYPPNWQLSARDDAGGCGRPCSAKPQPPSPSRRGSRGVCVGGARGRAGVLLGVRPAPGAPGPGGGGAPGSAAATAPPAAGALPEQRRSVGRLGASSAGLLALLAFLLRGLLLLPRPRRPLPQPAPPLPPCLPLLALSALTFPSPGQRRRAPRQPPAPLQTAGCERGCALYPVPASRGRSGENRTMPRARDQGAARARWLGTGLLGKAAPAWFLLPLAPNPSPTLHPPPRPRQRRGHLEEQHLGQGGLWSAARSERLPLLPGRRLDC